MANVRLLIQQSYRFGQILAEEGEDASSTQLSQGLILFNQILNKISIDGFEIPLITEETTNLISGQEDLDLPGWIKLLKVQYLQGTVKLPIELLDFNSYLSQSVITQSSGIPTIGYQKRTQTGITLKVFFKPNSDYPLYLTGYKTLINATLETDLAGSIEGFMQDYFLYQLANDLRDYYQMDSLKILLDKLDVYERKFRNLKFIRTDIRNINIGGDQPDSLAAINMGGGYSA